MDQPLSKTLIIGVDWIMISIYNWERWGSL